MQTLKIIESRNKREGKYETRRSFKPGRKYRYKRINAKFAARNRNHRAKYWSFFANYGEWP